MCECVPLYLCSQSLICNCSVAALFQVSQQPGEYLLAELWANYLYSYLCIFLLFCLSVLAFVFLPLRLSPTLSVWLCPISAGTSIEMRRWHCFRLFIYCLSLTIPHRVKPRVGLPRTLWSLFLVLYSHSKPVYLLFYMSGHVFLFLSLSLGNAFVLVLAF